MEFDLKELKAGQKIKFKNEKYWYAVRIVRHPFAICTLNLFGENYYTILDVERQIRGGGTNKGFLHVTDQQVTESMLALVGEHPEGFQQSICSTRCAVLEVSDVFEPKPLKKSKKG